MFNKLNLILFLLTVFIMTSYPQALKYPKTYKDNTKDNYFGTVVNDPYRWLEDDTAKAVSEWVKKENEVTYGYLNKITYRDKIKERLEKLWNYPKYSVPFKGGSNYFFLKTTGFKTKVYCTFRAT